MERKEGIFVVVNEALELNGATLLEDNASYCLVDDDKAGIYYIGLNASDVDVYGLVQEGRTKQNTVAVIAKGDLDLRPVEGFSRLLKVHQYVYRGEKYVLHAPFEIRPMGPEDFDYLSQHYMRVGDDDAYLWDAIRRGMLKAVDERGETMGFIGEHPEHALGMLYVDENHRRKGVGTALEKAMINKFIDEGKVPFDHVVIDNVKSMNLQRSLGMSQDEGCIHWYF